MFEKLYSLIFTDLIMDCPVLSGNMQFGIHFGQMGLSEIDIIIDAPFYDTNEWRKNKVVKHTGKSFNGITDYAYWVNKAGGFGTHNDSEHWVNRVLDNCCRTIANEYNAVVINELPL